MTYNFRKEYTLDELKESLNVALQYADSDIMQDTVRRLREKINVMCGPLTIQRIMKGTSTMSGILEEIRDLLKQIANNTARGTSGNTSNDELLDEEAPATKAPSKGKKIDHATLAELVQPLVQQEGTKAKVKAVLTKFGLKRLGDAKDEQYKELYAEFSKISNGASEEEEEDIL